MARQIDYKFDPQKTALENFFALIYRTNHVKLHPQEVEVEEPREEGNDPDGDNTVILVKALPDSMFCGEEDLYYARADIETYYPVFELDIEALKDIDTKEALVKFVDDQFDMVDGEFDLDLEDPIGDLMRYTSITMLAKDKSLIYIGKKTINIFWSGGARRITDEGAVRMTEDGRVRVLEL